MNYRILGKSDLRVSVIGMGTWQFGGEWGKDFTQTEATAMIRRAHELGINFIDTAECYGDHLSERLIGTALHDLGLRDQFLLATKFGHQFHEPFKRTEPRSPADIERQLEDSLRALQTDFIDLYQYHSWADAQFESADVAAVLDQAKRAGKIRHIGNSVGPNDKPAQIERSHARAVETIQIIYNRLNRAPEELIFPLCEKMQLGVLARVPLASGFLSGKYKPGAQFAENDVRAKWQSKGAEDRLAEVERIQKEEVPAGVPMAQWALAWCLKHPAVQCVIPGCKSVAQVESNAAAGDLPLIAANHPWAAPTPTP
jgi:myo-inositol catabolism protein IolS